MIHGVAPISELVAQQVTTALLAPPVGANQEQLREHLVALEAALECPCPGAQPIGVPLGQLLFSPVKHGSFAPLWLPQQEAALRMPARGSGASLQDDNSSGSGRS